MTDGTQRAPLRIKELAPAEVAAALARDPRLLVPVGTCEQHGPHLPLGCDTLVVERLVDDLSAELGILRAPTFEYGVNSSHARPFPGNASLRRKTLLRALNDLTETWEEGGVQEFILMTAHGYEGHQEALSTVITKVARVQVVDIYSAIFPDIVESDREVLHGDEFDTSLLMYIAPDLVFMDRAQDYIISSRSARKIRRSALKLPEESPGSVGRPTLASAHKGKAIYKRIKQLVRDNVLLAPPADE
jgi:creatinine amidohydrolase